MQEACIGKSITTVFYNRKPGAGLESRNIHAEALAECCNTADNTNCQELKHAVACCRFISNW